MNVHLVYAHPVDGSFASAIRDTVQQTLKQGGHVVDLLDLYAEDFEARLSGAERAAYHSPGQNLAGIEDYVDRLRRADALVLCFPTWWYGMPAILKGWFDRVWVPGVAFALPADGNRIQPLLRNIRKIGVVTTYGSPPWFIRLYLGDPNRKVLLRGLKPLCATNVQSLWLSHYKMDASTTQDRASFLFKIEKKFRRF